MCILLRCSTFLGRRYREKAKQYLVNKIPPAGTLRNRWLIIINMCRPTFCMIDYTLLSIAVLPINGLSSHLLSKPVLQLSKQKFGLKAIHLVFCALLTTYKGLRSNWPAVGIFSLVQSVQSWRVSADRVRRQEPNKRRKKKFSQVNSLGLQFTTDVHYNLVRSSHFCTRNTITWSWFPGKTDFPTNI